MTFFDEQPDADPHGECAAEITRLRGEIERLLSASPVPSSARLVPVEPTEEMLENGLCQGIFRIKGYGDAAKAKKELRACYRAMLDASPVLSLEGGDRYRQEIDRLNKATDREIGGITGTDKQPSQPCATDAAAQWRPIESAPSGEEILLGNIDAKGRVNWAKGGYKHKKLGLFYTIHGESIRSPNCWAALPSPPSIDATTPATDAAAQYRITVACNCGLTHESFELWQQCPRALTPRPVEPWWRAVSIAPQPIDK